MTSKPDPRLRNALEYVRDMPFPADSKTSEELSGLHADLVEYDGHVVGLVASILGGAAVERTLLAPDRAMRARLNLIVENASGQLAADARHHLAYLDALIELLAAARVASR